MYTDIEAPNGLFKVRNVPSADWAPDGAGVAYVENRTTIRSNRWMERRLDRSPGWRGMNRSSTSVGRAWRRPGSYPNDMVIIEGLR